MPISFLEGFFTLGIYYIILFYLTKSIQALNCVWTNETATFSWVLALNADNMGIFILSTVTEKFKNIIRFPVSLLDALCFPLLYKYKILPRLVHRNRVYF